MTETPKGRGRPKKVAKGFGKRKLNFDNIDASNLSGTSSLTDTIPVSLMNNAFICDECGEKVILSDPKRNNVKCLKCNTVMRVSDLKAVSPVKMHYPNANTISEHVPVAFIDSGESNCILDSVAQNTVNNAVRCDECGEKIIINDPKRNNVKCMNCGTVMRVSDLKPASSDKTQSETVVNSSANFSESNEVITLTDNVPVPLKNGENVCFFNSVVQVFYSLMPFRAHIYGETIDNHVIRNLRKLFREMEASPAHNIHTYPIVRALQIPHYRDRDQIDALEVVSFLIDNCVETDQITGIPDYAIFKMAAITSTICANCNKESSHTNYVPLITLDVQSRIQIEDSMLVVDSYEQQTVSHLLNRRFNNHGYSRPDYRCEVERDENGNVQGCNERGFCNSSDELQKPLSLQPCVFPFSSRSISHL